MAETKDSHARALLDELKGLVAATSTSFTAKDFYFDPEIAVRLPEVVSSLQRFIGKPADRTPFWNCVKAVDHHWPSLKLITTLDSMMERATSIPPAPLTRVLSTAASLSPTAWQRSFLLRWKTQSGKTFDQPPSDLSVCWRVLEAHVSTDFKDCYTALKADIARAFPLGAPKSVEGILGFAAFLDLHWQRTQWRERYMEAHEGLHLLLTALENEEYERMRARVLENSHPFSAEARERHLGAKRAKSFRRKQKVEQRGPKIARKGSPDSVTKRPSARKFSKRVPH